MRKAKFQNTEHHNNTRAFEGILQNKKKIKQRTVFILTSLKRLIKVKLVSSRTVGAIQIIVSGNKTTKVVFSEGQSYQREKQQTVITVTCTALFTRARPSPEH